MKHYIVYVNGVEQPGTIKAGSHNAAEKKAKKKHGKDYRGADTVISVAYTEI